MNPQLDLLTRYWIDQYARRVDVQDLKDNALDIPLVAIVGAHADVVGMSDRWGAQADDVWWLTGYLALPTNPIYVTACGAAWAIYEPDDEADWPEIDSWETLEHLRGTDPRLRRILFGCTYSTTDESYHVRAATREMTDDGRNRWELVEWLREDREYALDPESPFRYLAKAAHDYDEFSPVENTRSVARKNVERDHAPYFTAEFHAPGDLLSRAWEWDALENAQ